jgi:hypothetical protein
MKPRIKIVMKKAILVSLLWIVSLMFTSATPLGTAFTYSGRLKYQNQLANGNFDLQVKLFDAATAGNQVGQTLNVSALSFVNGLFVTSLDFGGGIFDGTAYWLEFAARPSGNGPFTLLSPRQPVNPAPYALFAPTAGLANAAAANSISSSSLQNNSVTSSKIASGQVVKSLNGLSDSVSLTAGANVTITPNGNALSIASSGSAIGWSLTGNAGTTPGVNFLGTSDNQPFEMRVNNVRALRLENIGSFFAGYSMNLIGGEVINQVSNGAMGATISGGGWSNPNGLDSPNLVSANFGTIGGGAGNSAAAAYATIPGGFGNQASGVGSFAAGQLARVTHDGSFLWNDGNQIAASSGPNRFDVFSGGGVNFHTGSSYVTAYSPFVVVNGLGGEQAYFGGDGAGSDVQLGSLNPAISTVALWNAGGSSYMNLYVATLTITGGSDLAEPFPISSFDISEGSVVVIDEEHPGELKVSSEPYDTHVAGIVSGANGINPGISLKQQGRLESGRNVALSGRVYVLADAAPGSIKPGDLLTTSPTPGHAMKVMNHARAQGAVLGKAMSTLSEGQGMVLVLVTLQ